MTADTRARLLLSARVFFCFVLLGPPIGGLVFLAGIALWAAGLSHLGDAAAMFAFLSLYGLPFSYVIGLPAAAVAGLALGYWRGFRGPVPLAALAGVGVTAGVAMTIAAAMNAAGNGETPPGLMVLTCLVPTLACGVLARVTRAA